MESLLEAVSSKLIDEQEYLRVASHVLGAWDFSSFIGNRIFPNQSRIKLADFFAHLSRDFDAEFGAFSIKNTNPFFAEQTTVSAELRLPARFPENQRLLLGSGERAEKEESKYIALVELLERLCFKLSAERGLRHCIDLKTGKTCHRSYHPENTSGMAIHTDPKLSLENAIFELIERDAYMCHWLTQIRPIPIVLREHRVFDQVQARMSELGLEFSAFLLKGLCGVPVVLVSSYDRQFRNDSTSFCHGISAAGSIEIAFDKAVGELVRFNNHCANLGGIARQVKSEISEPMGRFYYYLDPNRLGDLSVFMSDGTRPTIVDKKSWHKTSHKTKDLIKQMTRMGPLYLYPARQFAIVADTFFPFLVDCDFVQKPNYGDKLVINQSRIEQFSSQGSQGLCMKPHPLP
ncbi:YcaO-like family protein [Bdellovibrionota bacterium FG-2]